MIAAAVAVVTMNALFDDKQRLLQVVGVLLGLAGLTGLAAAASVVAGKIRRPPGWIAECRNSWFHFAALLLFGISFAVPLETGVVAWALPIAALALVVGGSALAARRPSGSAPAGRRPSAG